MFQRLTGKLSERIRPPGATSIQFDNAAYTTITDNSSSSQPSPEARRKAKKTKHTPVVGFSPDVHFDDEDGGGGSGSKASDKEDVIDFAYLEDIVNAIAELEVEKESETLDITKLNGQKIGDIKTWRDGPAPLSDFTNFETIKMASLEGNMVAQDASVLMHLNKKELSEHEMNYEATVALINYFSELAKGKSHSSIDYVFMEQILLSADINARDKHGQTIMHEVVREWNIDVAVYLKTRGCEIDLPDNWGRTPLFVAVSANYTEMVKWLIENGANINHETIEDERQRPIHFAARHDSVEAFDILIASGADPNATDGFGQTPLFVAAQYAQVRMVHHMLDLGLPVATANDDAVMCIELIISNLPTETAWRALDQHMMVDNVNRNKKFYVHWLSKKGALNKTNNSARQYKPPGALQIIVDREDMTLIMHPVVLQIIRLKSKSFAYKHRVMNIVLYLLFTILWSASISIHEVNTRGWTYNITIIFVLSMLAQILTFHFMYKIYSEYQSSLRHTNNEKKRSKRNITNREKYLHPRWISERVLFEKEADVIKRKSLTYWSSGWNVLEAICLCMATAQFILTVVWITRPSTVHISGFRLYFSAVFIVVVWIRLNNCFHSNQYVGAFVAMLGECVVAVARFGFLFCEFFIPFTCAFWVTFGGERKVLETTETDREYVLFEDLVYQMYLLTLVGDYDYEDLRVIDKLMAQILVGLYFVLVSVVTLNLFIALMSEAISRVNQIAAATAYLKEAKEINLLEGYFPNYSSKFEKYVIEECAPLVVKYDRLVNEMRESEQLDKVLMTSRHMVEEMQQTVKGFRDIMNAMDIFIEALTEFNGKYPPEKQEEYVAAIAKASSFYSTFLNKLQRKTFGKIAGLADKRNTEQFLDNS